MWKHFLDHRLEVSKHINFNHEWTFPLLSLGPVKLLGGIFHFSQILIEHYVSKHVETLIRCRVLLRLIWVCIVSLCPTKSTVILLAFGYSNRERSQYSKVLLFVIPVFKFCLRPKKYITWINSDSVKKVQKLSLPLSPA